MKACDYCGHENDQNTTFCRECGTQSFRCLTHENGPAQTTPRRDPLVQCAFLIALLTMIVPTQADVLDPLLRGRHLGLATLVFTLFFAAVLVPFLMSVRRRRRELLQWGSSGFLVATGAVLGLDVMWFASILIYQFFR
jgi:hypothetical protein